MGDVIDSTHMHINKGKADGRQGGGTTGIIFNIVDYSEDVPSLLSVFYTLYFRSWRLLKIF